MMGGDKVPTLLDPLVEWFEAWKATLQVVKQTPSRDYVNRPVHVADYLHGSPSRRRRT